MTHMDLQRLESPGKTAHLDIAEEQKLPTDKDIAVEETADVAGRMANNPQAAHDTLISRVMPCVKGVASHRAQAFRQLQRSYGNRYVGQVLSRVLSSGCDKSP